MSKYTYERNSCDCHPETCVCYDYKIMQGAVRVAYAFDEEQAKDLCERLNKEEPK